MLATAGGPMPVTPSASAPSFPGPGTCIDHLASGHGQGPQPTTPVVRGPYRPAPCSNRVPTSAAAGPQLSPGFGLGRRQLPIRRLLGPVQGWRCDQAEPDRPDYGLELRVDP